jgi:ribosome recycling factor
MSEIVSSILQDAEQSMKKAISHLEAELTKIRAGKANPAMLEGIMAEYYGSPTPISQIANITVMDVRTISIQPWEKNMLQLIERSIIAANLEVFIEKLIKIHESAATVVINCSRLSTVKQLSNNLLFD